MLTGSAGDSQIDQRIHVLDVETVARQRLTIHVDHKLRLRAFLLEATLGCARHLLNHLENLVRRCGAARFDRHRSQ